jgi:DHA2 family multidrug resistance protein
MIGETMFVSGLAMFCTAPIAGMMSSRLDPRVMMMMGFGGFALGTWSMTQMTADWDFYELLVPQILRGVSLMICMVPINNVALGTLSPDRIRNASGLFNLTRNLGGAVGLAVINTILTQRSQEHYLRLSEHVQWGNPEAVERMNSMAANYSAHGLDGPAIAVKQMAGMVQQQAYILSFIDIFVLLTGLFGTLVLCVLAIRKPQGAVRGGGGH